MACFTTRSAKKLSVDIGTEWLLYHVDQNRWDHHFKMIVFKGKMYSMTINDKNEISMIEYNNFKTKPKSDFSFDYQYVKTTVDKVNYNLNKKTGLLYIIIRRHIFGNNDNNAPNIDLVSLILYNMNAMKTITRYKLDCNDPKWTVDKLFKCQFEIILNSNAKDKWKKLINQKPFNVISNWTRNNIIPSTISIPNGIYIIINNYYSFYCIHNLMHIIFFCYEWNEKKNCSERSIYHTAVMIPETVIQEQTLEMSVLNVIKPDSDLILKNFSQILSFCYDGKLYAIFDDGRVEIDLETLQVFTVKYEKEWALYNFDPIKAYDPDERYVYFMRRQCHSGSNLAKTMELMCYDKSSLEMFLLRDTSEYFYYELKHIEDGLDIDLGGRCFDIVYDDHTFFFWGLEDNHTRIYFEIDFKISS